MPQQGFLDLKRFGLAWRRYLIPWATAPDANTTTPTECPGLHSLLSAPLLHLDLTIRQICEAPDNPLPRLSEPAQEAILIRL